MIYLINLWLQILLSRRFSYSIFQPFSCSHCASREDEEDELSIIMIIIISRVGKSTDIQLPYEPVHCSLVFVSVRKHDCSLHRRFHHRLARLPTSI